MQAFAFTQVSRLARLQMPVVLLIAFLQRTPVLRLLVSAETAWVSPPLGQLLRATSLAAAAVGAVDTLAGATQFAANPASPATATVGTPFAAAFAVTGAPTVTASYTISGLPPGLTVAGATTVGSSLRINASTGTITGTPTAAGNYGVSITAWEFANAKGDSVRATYTINVGGGAGTAPTITTAPQSQAVALGASATLSATAGGTAPFTYQWRRNGVDLSGKTGATLALTNAQPADAGVYSVAVTNSAGTTVSTGAIVGIASTAKVVGAGVELMPVDIHHANGRVFDQVLLTGTAETITADSGQITRTSYIDLNDDIVQVEFAGAGSLTLTLDSATGPANPVNYNQDLGYMRGHATLTIVGADESTNVSVFTVGKLTAFDPSGSYDFTKPVSETNNPANNQNAIFKAGANYDGIADIALLSIISTNGQFGGVRCANTQFFAASGLTGINMPGVNAIGPVNVYDVSASDAATPVLLTGTVGAVTVAGGGIAITGGDMAQPNGSAVQVGDAQHIAMLAGVNSHNVALPAQTNKAVYTRNGTDVTSAIVVNP